jgi:hypothetical protein
VAIDRALGEPVDSYVNGSQVWFTEGEPTDMELEWRLHPVAGYRRPDDVDTYDVFPSIALALGTGGTPLRSPVALWDGLEVFPAFSTDIEPMTLASIAGAFLGVAPDAVGMADHETIASEWEASKGGVSIIARLIEQLSSPT